MRNWGIILASLGLSGGMASPALANGFALAAMGRSFAGRPAMPPPVAAGTDAHRWGPRHKGRWYAGWYAPGGWMSYRRPIVGYALPRYWISPTYRIGNYGIYGLPAPMVGYGWSRYYDDAVLTDRDGRVRDYRSGVDWDERAQPAIPYDDEVTSHDGPPPPSAEKEGHYESQVRSSGVDFAPPPYAPVPGQAAQTRRTGDPVVTTTQAPGYFADGYYYPGATTTTVVIQPRIATTRTYVTETIVHRPARRRKGRK